jgi:ribosomal protein S18 acetylase RimI-like enzyme
MKVKILKRISKNFKEFSKKEWANADVEHYGKALDWKTDKLSVEAYEGEELKGTARIRIDEGVVYIETIIVAKDNRGNGLGKLLMSKVEEIARNKGAHKIYLDTGNGWSSVDFYKSSGYEITAELKDHYHRQDFIIMTKNLK